MFIRGAAICGTTTSTRRGWLYFAYKSNNCSRHGIAQGVALGLATENLVIASGVGITLPIALGYRGGRKDS